MKRLQSVNFSVSCINKAYLKSNHETEFLSATPELQFIVILSKFEIF